MGLFKKKNPEEPQEQHQPRNPNTMLIIRLMAVGYLLWTVWSLVQMYIAGGEDAPSLTMLICSAIFFVAAAAWIGWMTYKEYKRLKAEFDAYNEEMAEQVRLEEEAAAAAAEAEDEDYEDDDYEETDEEVEEETEEA